MDVNKLVWEFFQKIPVELSGNWLDIGHEGAEEWSLMTLGNGCYH